MAADALSLDQVHAGYGEAQVLHGVSLACGEGRLLGLLGRNGAGKSTCMNVVVGLLAARQGAVQVFGRPIGGRAPEAISAHGVALVPQGRRVFRSLSVRENLDVARQPARPGVLRAWTIARVFETFPRLGERAGLPAGSLSGGEQQMLAIGRALMGNPRLLLMDEPSEGLAPQIVAEVGRTIAGLRQEGLSIVLVEQNIQLVLDIADDIAILNTGTVVFQGPAASVRIGDDIIARNLGIH